jgi:hypothetical protein
VVDRIGEHITQILAVKPFVSGQRVTLMFSFNYLLNLQQDIIVLFA